MIRLDLPNVGLTALISFDRYNALILESPIGPQRILKARTFGALEIDLHAGSTWIPFPGTDKAISETFRKRGLSATVEHEAGGIGSQTVKDIETAYYRYLTDKEE